MKSKVDIEMDFSRAVSQANELESLSKELSNIATQQIEKALKLLACSWKGDNSELFTDKGVKLSDEILNMADDLIKIAKSVKSTAGIVYTAEKAAMRIGF